MTTDVMHTELGTLLDQYDRKRSALAQRQQQVRRDEEAFRTGFVALRAEVIRPVFEAAGAILKERGHDFRISESELGVDAGGKGTEAEISLHVTPAGQDKPAGGQSAVPSLAFVTRHYNKSVCVLASNALPGTSGAAGSRGDYRLAQIDTALVEAELLKLVSGIVEAY